MLSPGPEWNDQETRTKMMFKRLITIALLLLVSTTLHAQRFNKKSTYDDLRQGQWEASVAAVSQGSVDLEGEGGSSVEVDDSWGWGFSIGYNMNANWHFAYKLSMIKPDYEAVVVLEPEEGEEPVVRSFEHEMDRYVHQLNATWHWFEGPVTPFLQGGIGYTTLDTNIPSQPPTTGCWWDPWWGYICDTRWRTYDTSEFTYNLGIGVRWDVNGALFLRGSYVREWLEVDAGDLDFDMLSLEMGLMW
jgi:opacity protein-like surface antigen